MFRITGTLISGWVFKQKDRIDILEYLSIGFQINRDYKNRACGKDSIPLSLNHFQERTVFIFPWVIVSLLMTVANLITFIVKISSPDSVTVAKVPLYSVDNSL